MGRKVWVPAVSGPLAGYAAGYGSWLNGVNLGSAGARVVAWREWGSRL
jgi:hypothetical protein